MKSSEDFLLVVLHAHAVAAANTICSLRPDLESVSEVSEAIVANYILLPNLDVPEPKKSKTASKDNYPPDQINLYAMEVLTLSLLWHGFHDTSKEGDGDRFKVYWKFLLITFKSSRNYNYAKEAVNLLLAEKYLLSERKAAQLLWSRTVNTRGIPGGNIPMDLHMEHLNRRLKTIISRKGANVGKKATTKAGKCVRVIEKVCDAFTAQTTGQCTPSDKHSYPSFTKDFQKILNVLEEIEAFISLKERKHSCFSMKHGLLQTLSKDKLIESIKKNVDQLITSP